MSLPTVVRCIVPRDTQHIYSAPAASVALTVRSPSQKKLIAVPGTTFCGSLRLYRPPRTPSPPPPPPPPPLPPPSASGLGSTTILQPSEETLTDGQPPWQQFFPEGGVLDDDALLLLASFGLAVSAAVLLMGATRLSLER